MIYLDFAATSAVRPPAVADAVTDFLVNIGASAGRGAYRPAAQAGRITLHCRQAIAELFRLPGDAGRVAFMLNATHAINTVLSSVLRPGDVCVTTVFDHNAVRRPVLALARQRGVVVRTIPGTADGALDLDAARRMIPGARLVVINGVSNVLGTRLPIEALVALARSAGALTLLDTAQLAGHASIDVARMGVDLVAFTGHKALLGPQGVGGLWAREGVELDPLLRGGSGGDSTSEDMPRPMPDRLEAGTQNVAGIAGLLTGIRWLGAHGVDANAARQLGLAARLHEGVAALQHVRVLSPPPSAGGAPIVTCVPTRLDPAELALRLDRLGVCCRAGLHCAPDTHRLLGTAATGAVRFSTGWSSTEGDVDDALLAVERALAGRPAMMRPERRLQHGKA